MTWDEFSSDDKLAVILAAVVCVLAVLTFLWTVGKYVFRMIFIGKKEEKHNRGAWWD